MSRSAVSTTSRDPLLKEPLMLAPTEPPSYQYQEDGAYTDFPDDSTNTAATALDTAPSIDNTSCGDTPSGASALDEAPPPYSAEPSWRLTYVDFTPRCLSAGGILRAPTFETFDVLVAKANDYLLRHPDTAVVCLETTRFTVREVKRPGLVVDTRVATISETATGFLVLGLRMWIRPCYAAEEEEGEPLPEQSPEPTQVGYLNVVPACLHPGGIFKRPVFDTLNSTVKKLNALLTNSPLPGRVLTIETVALPFRQYGKWVEPDRCHWRRYSDVTTSHMYCLRVYYEACDQPHPVTIDYKDFVPRPMSKTHRLLHPTEKFESVYDVTVRAGMWLSENRENTALIGIESALYPEKKSGADSEQMLCFLYSNSQLLQCLRLWLSTPSHTDNHTDTLTHSHTERQSSDMIADQGANQSENIEDCCTHGPVLGLQCRVFCPEQVVEGGMFSSPVFESMIDTRQRLKDWALTRQDECVLAAESVRIKLHSGVPEELWSAITHHRGNLDYHAMHITVLRLYYTAREPAVSDT